MDTLESDNSVNQQTGCRVLTISASLEGAMLFVERAYLSRYSPGVVLFTDFAYT